MISGACIKLHKSGSCCFWHVNTTEQQNVTLECIWEREQTRRFWSGMLLLTCKHHRTAKYDQGMHADSQISERQIIQSQKCFGAVNTREHQNATGKCNVT